eukprot:CAMPEP_0115753680 /NCGR_PEP_ID=MMETSP0272-20121206/96458_1 /TAXON_ID=71861 /ORGANISM="Scrippsiella trochoidea, Strain CCMP3099" /LENGTH=73 /DNA_ID=CAMNT_0003199021 /DNA_START=22 /DNA_END=241 /DNA_ORIENTATION=-
MVGGFTFVTPDEQDTSVANDLTLIQRSWKVWQSIISQIAANADTTADEPEIRICDRVFVRRGSILVPHEPDGK